MVMWSQAFWFSCGERFPKPWACYWMPISTGEFCWRETKCWLVYTLVNAPSSIHRLRQAVRAEPVECTGRTMPHIVIMLNAIILAPCRWHLLFTACLSCRKNHFRWRKFTFLKRLELELESGCLTTLYSYDDCQRRVPISCVRRQASDPWLTHNCR